MSVDCQIHLDITRNLTLHNWTSVVNQLMTCHNYSRFIYDIHYALLTQSNEIIDLCQYYDSENHNLFFRIVIENIKFNLDSHRTIDDVNTYYQTLNLKYTQADHYTRQLINIIKIKYNASRGEHYNDPISLSVYFDFLIRCRCYEEIEKMLNILRESLNSMYIDIWDRALSETHIENLVTLVNKYCACSDEKLELSMQVCLLNKLANFIVNRKYEYFQIIVTRAWNICEANPSKISDNIKTVTKLMMMASMKDYSWTTKAMVSEFRYLDVIVVELFYRLMHYHYTLQYEKFEELIKTYYNRLFVLLSEWKVRLSKILGMYAQRLILQSKFATVCRILRDIHKHSLNSPYVGKNQIFIITTVENYMNYISNVIKTNKFLIKEGVGGRDEHGGGRDEHGGGRDEHGGGVGAEPETECLVCMDNIADVDITVVMCQNCQNCLGHIICAANWLRSGNGCPLCRWVNISYEKMSTRSPVRRRRLFDVWSSRITLFINRFLPLN